jgi:hypothetical protein
VGLFIGLIYGFRARVMARRPRTVLIIAAVLCSMASLVALAWVVAVSNQAFRVAARNDPFIPKGLAESTLGELRSVIDVNRRAAIRLPPMAGAWLPNAVFVAAVVLLLRRTSNPNPEPERRTEPEHELRSENREV